MTTKHIYELLRSENDKLRAINAEMLATLKELMARDADMYGGEGNEECSPPEWIARARAVIAKYE